MYDSYQRNILNLGSITPWLRIILLLVAAWILGTSFFDIELKMQPFQKGINNLSADSGRGETKIQSEPIFLNSRWQFVNSRHNLQSFINENGWHLMPISNDTITPNWSWHYTFQGIENSNRNWNSQVLKKPNLSLVSATKILLTYDDGIQEFYENTPDGVKQGFLIPASAARGEASELILHGKVQTRLTVRQNSPDGLTYALSGVEAFRYTGLRVFDARGKQLASRIAYTTGHLTNQLNIHIETSGAEYPITVDPLAIGPVWAIESNVTFGRFGYRVAGVGDVNGDGFADVIVSSTKYDQEYDEGKVAAFYGSAAGLSTAESWAVESNQASSQFGAGVGASVAMAGDVNGDGFADVIVGAPAYDNGQLDEGRVFLYLGSAQGLSANPSWIFEGDVPYANFGFSVGSAGDVNQDGFGDIVVGATGLSKVFLFYGSPSGPTQTPNWISGAFTNCSQIGFSTASAGDVNGDSYSDLIIGSIYCSNGQTNEGQVFVYHGSSVGLSAEPDWAFESDQVAAHLGYSIAGAGDVNGDGYGDVIVGAIIFDNGENNEGRVFLFLGSATGLSLMPDWSAESNQNSPNGELGAVFGSDLAGVGDVDGDGFADVLIGARGYDFNGFYKDNGRIYLYNGTSSGLAANPSWIAEPISTNPNQQCGTSIDGAGDVNGDGYSDIIYGCHGYDNGQVDEGIVYLHYGEPIPTPTPTPTPTATVTPAVSPTISPSPTATATASPSPSQTATATPTTSPPTATPTPELLGAPKIQIINNSVVLSVTRRALPKEKVRFMINGARVYQKLGKKRKWGSLGKFRYSAKFAGLSQGAYQASWELRRGGVVIQQSFSRNFTIK